jgi:hypothetical protein
MNVPHIPVIHRVPARVLTVRRISMKRIRNKVAALAAVLTVAGLGLVVAPAQSAHAIITCGTWRWPVKTGSDADRYRVSRTVRYTTVHHLRSLTAPSSFPTYYQNHRFRGRSGTSGS